MSNEQYVIDFTDSDFGTVLLAISRIAQGNVSGQVGVFVATCGNSISNQGTLSKINIENGNDFSNYVFHWIDGLHLMVTVASGEYGMIRVLKMF